MGERVKQKWKRHEHQENNHQDKLDPNDLAEGRMEATNCRNEQSAESQLHITCIGNLVRHLERDDHNAEGVDDGCNGVKCQKISKVVFPHDLETGSEESGPDAGGRQIQPE